MKNKKEQMVIFDFCETLVNFQTADAYIDYCRNQLKISGMNHKEFIRMILNKTKILSIIGKLTRNKYSINKKLKLWQLKGIEESILNELSFKYYIDKIKPNLIEKTCSILNKYIQDNNVVWIVSGGYGIYLKHFVKEFGVSNIISSNIQFKNGHATGKLDGIDCMHDNKVKLLINQLSNKNNYSIIASYSDSISDIPILSIAEKAYIISYKIHKEWIDKYKFNEIIWN